MIIIIILIIKTVVFVLFFSPALTSGCVQVEPSALESPPPPPPARFDQFSLFLSSLRVYVCLCKRGQNPIVDMVLKKCIACSNLIEINMQF